jgi:hypothetical protein
MDRELSDDAIADLLAAYAVDAVDDNERAAIGEYLTRTPEARDEVDEMQAVASILAYVGGPSPKGLWERIEAVITDSSSPLRVVATSVGVARPTPGPRRGRSAHWFAVAASVVALVFAGLWFVDGTRGSTATRDTAAMARTASTARGARRVVLTESGGHALATAVVLPDGTGYLTPALPALSSHKTYQLWGITKTRVISLGVLGPSPGAIAFQAAPPTLSLAITTETAGGVPVSRNAPTAVGDVTSS